MLNELLLNPIVAVSELTMKDPAEVVFIAGVTLLIQFEYPEVTFEG